MRKVPTINKLMPYKEERKSLTTALTEVPSTKQVARKRKINPNTPIRHLRKQIIEMADEPSTPVHIVP